MTVVGIPTSVLVAPDSFKGTLAAADVATAIARGLRAGGRATDICPVADGGEGTLDALLEAFGGETVRAAAHDPLGRAVETCFGLARDGSVGIVEVASASGLDLVEPALRDPIAASTHGTGELIAAAIESGAREVLVGAGGSASTDGGTGALRAIAERGGTRDARLVVLCDVRTPFEDAARVFAPQKGADAEGVRRLSRRLGDLARRLERDPREVPMTGAAGGLAGGLWSALHAELVPGASFVLDALRFDQRMRDARAVVTGEGKLDLQSLAGKAVSEIATRSRQAGVPCHAIVGRRKLDSFGLRVLDLQAVFEAGTLPDIEAAGLALAELL